MNTNHFTKIILRLNKFREQRNWKKYHTIKDLLIALNIEIAELQELILWKNNTEINMLDKVKVEEEIADIFIYLTYISEYFNVDLLKAVDNKIDKNELKYPIEKSFGSNKKYNELDDE